MELKGAFWGHWGFLGVPKGALEVPAEAAGAPPWVLSLPPQGTAKYPQPPPHTSAHKSDPGPHKDRLRTPKGIPKDPYKDPQRQRHPGAPRREPRGSLGGALGTIS